MSLGIMTGADGIADGLCNVEACMSGLNGRLVDEWLYSRYRLVGFGSRLSSVAKAILILTDITAVVRVVLAPSLCVPQGREQKIW
jgi:hypothetical protein